jgi:predicted ATPase
LPAELLCLRHGGSPTECFLDLADATSDDVFRGLEELVTLGVVESVGQDYVFTHAELREVLARSIEPARRRQLHARWADWLLARTPLDDDSQLEAGRHLVHTERALLGADLLAKIGPALIERRVAMSSAIPAVELALELYEQHGVRCATASACVRSS